MKTCTAQPLAILLMLCCTGSAAVGQTIDFGKSYLNITKGTNGGTVETGDVLEIRASFVVRTGTFDSCSFTDAIPAGTSYIPNTVRVLTNEGKIYKQFTDAPGDDAGWINGTTVRINLGYNPASAPATAFVRGRVAANQVPRFGGACIMIASFTIRVNVAIGSTISIGGGTATYRSGAANPVQTHTYPANIVAVYQNQGICTNTVGVNALGTESNGTFGSGTVQNRGASANVPVGYTYSTFTNNMPNDYYYGIANNTSNGANLSTSNAWPKPDNSTPTHRVFSVWDIIGDHTGAANPALGNNPAAANANGGYMLVINAAYRIDSAFQQTISGLCPNTYYEISCWMRNICSRCGSDSLGRGAGNTGYIPTAPNDSAGVRPNITFEVDGVDYYSTGNLPYTGQWVKKGFTFRTGPTQTSFTLKFFNNAPGGGGNDWALDDISVATCSPELQFTPSNNPTICQGNTVSLGAIVRSYFNNYTWYKWQRSTNGGATWTDVSSPATATPVLNGSNWEYSVAYPTFVTTMADNGLRFKVLVASTAPNLSNTNCSAQSSTSVITLNVINCTPLIFSFLSFTASQNATADVLQWQTSGNHNNVHAFIIEKSADGARFDVAGKVSGAVSSENISALYTWTGPLSATPAHYRLVAANAAGQRLYSRTIPLGNGTAGAVQMQLSRFAQQQWAVHIHTTTGGGAHLEVRDITGRLLQSEKIYLRSGVNSYRLPTQQWPAAGTYSVQFRQNGRSWVKPFVNL